MKLNTIQAAEKLKVTTSTIRSLIARGLLTDLTTRNPKKQKHYPLVDSRQVNEFAKTYKKKQRLTNGALEHKPLIGPSIFSSRLDRIEEKLDKLISMWS